MRFLWVLALTSGLTGCAVFGGSSKGLSPLPDGAGLETLTSPWQATIGAPGTAAFQPATAGAAVFAANQKGEIARFENGREIWRITAGVPLSAGLGANANSIVAGTAKGEVLSYSPDGKPLWRVRVSSEIVASPVLTDTLVLVRTTDNRIHALDVKDGTRRWAYQRTSPALVVRSAAKLIVQGNTAYAGFPGGKLVAISLDNGAAVWESTIALPRGATELERVADITSEPVAANRAICAVAFQGRIACVDGVTGTGIWSRDLSSVAGLTTDGRNVFVTDEKGNIFGMDAATGATLWKQDQLAGRQPSRPVFVKRTIGVVDAQGWVHLLRPTNGSITARTQGRGAAISAPVVLGEGFLVQDAAGRLTHYTPD